MANIKRNTPLYQLLSHFSILKVLVKFNPNIYVDMYCLRIILYCIY